MDTQPHTQLGRQIKETKAFSTASLFFAILSSVVSAAIIPALGADRIATLGGAVLSPVLVATISTQRNGRGLVRSVAIACLSAVALLITISGFTLPEAIAGAGSLTGDGAGTFVDTERRPESPESTSTTTPVQSTTSPPGIKVELPASRTCPTVQVGESVACKQIGVRNIGTTTIQIDSADPEGDQAGQFVVTKACHGTLKPNSACSVKFHFAPTTAGLHQVVLIVRLNPGDITRRVTIKGDAGDNTVDPPVDPTGCREGFVPRLATPTDHVCVTPAEQEAAHRQNVLHVKGHRADIDGNCVDEYVFRAAVPGDQICVTTDERAAAQQQNTLGPERFSH